MLVHTNKDGKYKFEREGWIEWFRLEVAGLSFKEDWFVLPKGFIKVARLENRDIDVYYIWFFVPFIKLWLLLEKLWWTIPKWLYRKGYIKYTEGERMPWFWLKRIKFKKQ